jgi:hypothetical protein
VNKIRRGASSQFFVFVLSIISGLVIITPSILFADNINPQLLKPNAVEYNTSFPEWTTTWWKWILSIPESSNPLTDSTGEYCGQGQSGPVWFLAGTLGGNAERVCTIPQGKPILLPIMNAECSFLDFPAAKTVSELTACSKEDNTKTKQLKASLDGKQLTKLDNYRVLSPLFNITIPEHNVLGLPGGKTQMISDGFWLFLTPLAQGKHDLQFSGLTPGDPTVGTNNFAVNATYHLTVK